MIFICTYSNGNVGLAQELQRYLIRKKASFFLLLHPIDLSLSRRSVFEQYKDGELTQTSQSWASPMSYPVNYFRCLLTTFWALLRSPQARTFIGFSNVDALAAVAVRLFRPLKVVFVSTDFQPVRRFQNPVLNTIYEVADRLIYRWADVTWHMYPERGVLKKYKRRTRTYDVLDGNNFRRVQRLPLEQINPFRLVYIGQINRDCRLDEALEAIGKLKTDFPDVGIDIISSGDPDYERRLRELTVKLDIVDRVVFYGQIRSPDVYEPIITRCGVGLCLYEIDEKDLAWYGTPLKVYLYAACGLPTLFSDTMGPFTVEYINNDGIGVMAPRGTLEQKLRELFANSDCYRTMRESTIAWAAKFDYNDKFDKFLSLV